MARGKVEGSEGEMNDQRLLGGGQTSSHVKVVEVVQREDIARARMRTAADSGWGRGGEREREKEICNAMPGTGKQVLEGPWRVGFAYHVGSEESIDSGGS